MRVCVTGAAGFIGSHLVAFLKERGHWVRAVDMRQVPERQGLYGRADQVLRADLRHRTLAMRAFAGCDWVFHLAADHGGAGYFHSRADYPAARNNMQIDLNVLDAAGALDVGRVFYASSFCAYPTAIQEAGAATDLHEGLLDTGPAERLYGSEKRQMTLFLAGAPFDARAGVFATIYGPGQEAEGIRAKFPTAITRRVLDAKQSGQPGEIELWGDGSQVRTFLYVTDAVRRIYNVMAHPSYEGPVNIASDEDVTVLECAEWVCELAGVEPRFDFRLDRPTGVAHRTPDNAKYRRVYGDMEQTPMRDGFRLLYESMAAEPARAAA